MKNAASEVAAPGRREADMRWSSPSEWCASMIAHNINYCKEKI